MAAFQMAKKSNAIENLNSCVCYSSATHTARPGLQLGQRGLMAFEQLLYLGSVFSNNRVDLLNKVDSLEMS